MAFPKLSKAFTVTLKATPAVDVDGPVTVKLLIEPTVKLALVVDDSVTLSSVSVAPTLLSVSTLVSVRVNAAWPLLFVNTEAGLLVVPVSPERATVLPLTTL